MEMGIDIRYYYEGDKPLLDKYHIKAPCTIEEAIVHTENSVQKVINQGAELHKQPEFYCVWMGEHLIAYCIKKEHRETAKPLFEKFIADLGITQTALYEKNQRAIRYFTNIGFVTSDSFVDEEEGETYIILTKCQ